MTDHVHDWRQHCPKHVCGWRRCTRCGHVEDMSSERSMDPPKPPVRKDKP